MEFTYSSRVRLSLGLGTLVLKSSSHLISYRFTSWDSRQPCMELAPQDSHSLSVSRDSLSVIGLLKYVPMVYVFTEV